MLIRKYLVILEAVCVARVSCVFLCFGWWWWWQGELILSLSSERGSDKIPVSAIPAHQEFTAPLISNK